MHPFMIYFTYSDKTLAAKIIFDRDSHDLPRVSIEIEGTDGGPGHRFRAMLTPDLMSNLLIFATANTLKDYLDTLEDIKKLEAKLPKPDDESGEAKIFQFRKDD